MYKKWSKYFGSLLITNQCRFQKEFSSQYCLLAMLEKFKEAINKRNHYATLFNWPFESFLLYLSQTSNCKTLWKGRFIVSLKNNFSYLKHKTQSNKINDCFSARSNFENGIPQGSILGQLLLYINMINLFFECEENDIANYVDDRSPYSLSS